MKLKEGLFSYLKFLIGWPLSAIALFFILKLIYDRGNEIVPYLKDLDYVLLATGFILFIAYFLLRSFLWLEILRSQGESVSFLDNTYRFSFSEMKRYVPGNIWSFLSRASMFQDAGVGKRSIGIAIISDIQLVVIGGVLSSLFAIPWVLESGEELALKLSSLIPISLIAVVAYFLGTGYFYKMKFGKNESLIRNLVLPGIVFKDKVKLSLISTLCFFIFGLANYFIFKSAFPNIESILIFSSFFVFSMLLGYLSFITPMGLGVREGIIILGLSKIVTVVEAGFVAIFTRIILIASELSFLVIVLIWKQLKRE